MPFLFSMSPIIRHQISPFPAKACAAQIMGSKYGEFSKLSTYGKINYEINNINDTTNRKLIIGLNWCTEGGRSG